MKKLYVCQIIDHVSETVVSTFTAPTPAYFDRQMESFFKDCEKKHIPVTDFEGFVIANVDICETYSEAEALLQEGELYTYIGRNFLDLVRSQEAKEVENEVPSDV